MKTIFSFILVFIVSPLLAQSKPTKLDKLEPFAKELQSKHQIPGLAIGIVQNGKLIYTRTLGYRDLEGKKGVTTKTVFGLGSTSKAFTSLAAALQVDKGLLTWDLAVKEVLPSFELSNKEAESRATLVDLLSHQVGQARHDMSWLGSPFSREQLFSKLKFFEFNLAFRQKWQYSNLLYMAAGQVVEKVSDLSWENIITDSIFKPLGMSSSNTSTVESEKLSDFSYPYKMEGNLLSKRAFRRSENLGPAASVNSNLEDMANWLKFQLSQKDVSGNLLLSPENFQAMHLPRVLVPEVSWDKYPEFTPSEYALGWSVQKYRGTKLIRHGGSLGGFLSTVAMFPDLNAGIVILQNYDGFGINSYIMLRALDLLLGLEPIDWVTRLNGLNPMSFEEDSNLKETGSFNYFQNEGSEESNEEDLSLQKFKGVYEHPGYGILRIDFEQKVLKLFYNDWNAKLSLVSPTRFMAKGWWDGRVDFNLSSNGVVESLQAPFEETVPDIVFKKIR